MKHALVQLFLLLVLFSACRKKEDPSDVTPKTKPHPKNLSFLVDKRDGQIYRSVKIGNQWWMADNLNYKTEKGSWYYDNDSAKYAKPYGRLYLWSTALNGEAPGNNNPSGIRGISPEGWHIPSNAEWFELRRYLSAKNHYSEELLQPEKEFWKNGSHTGRLKFNAVFAGNASNNGTKFTNINNVTYFFTATTPAIDSSYLYTVFYADSTIEPEGKVWGWGFENDSDLGKFYLDTANAYSIRCVKDR